MSQARVLVLGASSAIAECLLRMYADRGYHLTLVARDADKLKSLEREAKSRGASSVETICVNLSQEEAITVLILSMQAKASVFDLVIFAWGILGDNLSSLQSTEECLHLFRCNTLMPIAICNALLKESRLAQGARLVFLSSVAGDRGRAQNFMYGASKAALTTYASGLRALLAPHGIHVITVKPGMVDTPMTAHLPKTRLFSQPEKVAKDIDRAIIRRKDVIYTPALWFWIMLIIRCLPEAVFKKLKF